MVRDPRFARQWLSIQTDDGDGPKQATLVLQPSTIIEGRVLAADTGQPIPDASIGVLAGRDHLGSMYTTWFRADAQGRFTANPSPGGYFRVNAYASDGQPFLARQEEFAWTKGTVKRTMDIRLPRGVLIRGKVMEEKTGRPLAGASVQFIAARRPSHVIDGSQAVVASVDDGSFQIVVPPGRGHLFVYGPTADYVLEAIGSRMLNRGQPGGSRHYAHRIIPYDVKTGDHAGAITATLRPGKIIKGRVIGPQAQAVEQGRDHRHAPLQLLPPSVAGRHHHPRPRRPLRAARLRHREGDDGLFP